MDYMMLLKQNQQRINQITDLSPDSSRANSEVLDVDEEEFTKVDTTMDTTHHTIVCSSNNWCRTKLNKHKVRQKILAPGA